MDFKVKVKCSVKCGLFACQKGSCQELTNTCPGDYPWQSTSAWPSLAQPPEGAHPTGKQELVSSTKDKITLHRLLSRLSASILLRSITGTLFSTVDSWVREKREGVETVSHTLPAMAVLLRTWFFRCHTRLLGRALILQVTLKRSTTRVITVHTT